MQKEKEEPKLKTPQPSDDPIIAILGSDMGPWQFWLCMLIFLSKFPSGFVQTSVVFLINPIKYWCAEPGNDTDACSEDCVDIEFDKSVFEANVRTEFELVCEDDKLASLSQTILMAGIMFGSILFGIFSDRWGRKWTFIVACLLNCFFGLAVSTSPNFATFCVFRFILAFATGGMMVVSIVIIMEMIGKKYREAMSILYQIPFNLGHATLPIFAYFIREWRKFHMAFQLVSLLYLIYICTLSESARWLLVRGEIDKASEILERGAKFNKMPTEGIKASLEKAHKALSDKAPIKKGTMLDLFRTPRLCLKTIIMAFNWMVVCMTYYGVAQYTSKLAGNIFVNVAIGAWLGVPGTICCVPLTKYWGRKPTLISSNLLSAICLIGIAFIGDSAHTLKVILISVGLFGASVTFPNVYLYGAELFPTVVRSSGIGLCSFVGRVGSMVSPFMTDLDEYGEAIPPILFGLFSLAAGLGVLYLPETRNTPLPETLEDGENFGKKTA